MRSAITASTSGWSAPSHVRTISGSERPASSSKYSLAVSGLPCSAKSSMKIAQHDRLVVGERAVEVEDDRARHPISVSHTIRMRSPRKTSREISTGRPSPRRPCARRASPGRRCRSRAPPRPAAARAPARAAPLRAPARPRTGARIRSYSDPSSGSSIRPGKRSTAYAPRSSATGFPVGKAHALDRVDALAERALVGLGGSFARAEDASARGEPEIAELIGEGGGARELEPCAPRRTCRRTGLCCE